MNTQDAIMICEQLVPADYDEEVEAWQHLITLLSCGSYKDGTGGQQHN